MRKLLLFGLVLTICLPVLLPVAAFAAPLWQDTPATPVTAAVAFNAALRDGPGYHFAVVAQVKGGSTLELVACNSSCTWYQTVDGPWVPGVLLLTPPSSLPTVAAANAESALPAEARPTARPQGTSTPSLAAATVAATPVPQTPVVVSGPRAASEANLRAGPGTSYSRVGGVTIGQTLALAGRNEAGDWYQLVSGEWIAAFLVSGAPGDLPIVESPEPPPTLAASSPASTEITLDTIKQAWDEGADLNQTMSCGHFEFKVTDVRRTKKLWLYSNEYVAQGEWLLLFVEVKNTSPGTSYFGRFSPRLTVLTADGSGRIASGTGDSTASRYASWMYQHGRFYENISPGAVLGLVEAYDLPLEPDMLLGFGLLDCPEIRLSLGLWSTTPQADPR